MLNYQLIFIFYILYPQITNTCFQQSNPINYLFLNDISQIKIPLIPLDCFLCQSASYVDIQLIDKQFSSINRTIQHIKIFLKNFEIEDSSYICLIHICPILVEYGSDSIILNISSALFSHVFLSLIYFNHSIICSIQTHFAIYSLEKSLICTKEVYLHPRFHIQLFRQFKIYDCQIDENIYLKSIQFSQKNLNTIIKSSENTCEYLLENINNLNNHSLINTNELSSSITIYPVFNPWKKDIQIIGPCRTKIIQYQEMFFTDNIVNIRNIYIKKGETIQIQCPIDGSEKYLKYTWYYQRYQPKYQISINRIITLNNITEQMQGTYMCIGDDGNDKLEFEMTLQILNPNKTNNNNNNNLFYLIIILILLVLFCLIITFIIYILLKKSIPITKSKSLTIHHDVLFTIQHLSEIWNQTLDYIDHPSWIKQNEIPYRFSTRQRNVNRQLSANIPLIKSNIQISDKQHNDIEILKISLPLLNQYPIKKSSSSIISFDSQNELDEFNQMTSICVNQ